MSVSYPDLDPPQHARFPVPVSEFPPSDGLWANLTDRLESDPFHLLGLLFLIGVSFHFWYAVRLARLNQTGATPRGRIASFLAKHPHASLCLWLVPLFLAAASIHGGSEALKFGFHDGQHRNLWHLAIVMLVALSRPGQLFIEKCLTLPARRLGGSRTVWWWVILLGAPILSSLCSVVAVVPIASRFLHLHVYEGGGPNLRKVSLTLFFTNLALCAALGRNSGTILPRIDATPWEFWWWKIVVVMILLLVGSFLLVRPRLRLGSRLPTPDPSSETETGEVPTWAGWLAGGLLVALLFLGNHPGWLVVIPIGFSVLLMTLGVNRPFKSWRLALPLLLLGLLWIPLGRCQHWWSDSFLDVLPQGLDLGLFGLLAALTGSLGGFSLIPAGAGRLAEAGVLAFGGVGLAAVATWMGLLGEHPRPRLLPHSLVYGLIAAALLAGFVFL